MFGSLNTSTTASTKRGNQFKSKKYFKDNKLSGLYQDFDPYTGNLKEEGRFQNGVEVGKWRVIDDDGDEIHYSYTMQRVGAICGDGSRSSATGRGACSWHGGVAEWLYDSVRSQVGGTGKYMPIQDRVDALKNEVRTRFKINKQGLEFQEAILNMLLDFADQKEELEAQVAEFEELLLNQAQAKKQLQDQIENLKQAHSKCNSKDAPKPNSKDSPKQYAKPTQKINENRHLSDASDDQPTQPQPQRKDNTNQQAKGKESVLKQDKKPTLSQSLFEKVKPKQQVSQTQKKEVKVQQKKKKKEESDNSVSWQSDWQSQEEDQREKGQRALIEQLFQKMNLK